MNYKKILKNDSRLKFQWKVEMSNETTHAKHGNKNSIWNIKTFGIRMQIQNKKKKPSAKSHEHMYRNFKLGSENT